MSAVMDAVASATAGVSRLYPLNEVPTGPTYPYGSYSASLGRGDVVDLMGREGIRWGRVVVQTFAKTTGGALDLAEQVRTAIVGTPLAITGYSATPAEQEIDPQVVRDPDNQGVIGVTQTFTFTATKEP